MNMCNVNVTSVLTFVRLLL